MSVCLNAEQRIALLAALVAMVCLFSQAVRAQSSTHTYNVPAAANTFDTGLDIAPGATVTFTASGQINVGFAGVLFGPVGDNRFQNPADISPLNPPVIAPAAHVFALVGWIGSEGPFEIGVGASVTAIAGGRLRLAINDNVFFDNSGSLNVALTVTLQTASTQRQDTRTAQLIGQFLGQRNNQLLTNQHDIDRQIDRLDGIGGSSPLGTNATGFDASIASGSASRSTWPMASPAFARPNGVAAARASNQRSEVAPAGSAVATLPPDTDSGAGTRISFATSLSDVLQRAVERERSNMTAMGIGINQARPFGAATTNQPLDFWIEGRFAEFQNRTKPDGHYGILSVGADYVLSKNLLVGALIQVDSMSERSNSEQSQITGTGFLIGPYATMRLAQNIFLQSRAAWGLTHNSVSPYLSYADSFDSQRWLLTSTLAGSWTFGAWSFNPSATIAFVEDRTDAYIDSTGASIPSLHSSLGQFRAGPKLGYRWVEADGTTVQPHAGIQVVWNFAGHTSVDDQAPLNVEAPGPSGVRGRVDLGVTAATSSGINLDFSGSYDGVGSSGYEAWIGRAAATIPLN